MHIVNVTIAGSSSPVGLFYDTADQAGKAVDALMGALDPHGAVSVPDAKGHSLTVLPRNVCCVVVVDMDKDLKNQQAVMLAQSRAQQAFERSLTSLSPLVMPAANGGLHRQ